MNHDGGSLCAEEVKSFNEFHCALDNMVILLSEHRMDTENYKKLDRAVEGIRDSQNPVEAADYNFRFHHALALVSGNTLAPLFYTAFKSTFTSLWERYAQEIRNPGTLSQFTRPARLYPRGPRAGGDFVERPVYGQHDLRRAKILEE